MNSRDIKPVILPTFLQRDLIKNVSVEEVHFLPQNEVFMREETGELFLHKEGELDKTTRRPKDVFGRVGIMLATIVDEETNHLLSGFVADLRFIENANEFSYASEADAPDDQEEFSNWQQMQRDELPIAAITVWDVDKEFPFVVGDQRFGAAALYLAEVADKIDDDIAEYEISEASKKAADKKLLAKVQAEAEKKATAGQADEKAENK